MLHECVREIEDNLGETMAMYVYLRCWPILTLIAIEASIVAPDPKC